MTLTGLQFLVTYGSIRSDGEYQVINGGFTFIVIRVGLVTDYRVLLVGYPLERTGADRLLVKCLRRSGSQHLVGILG
jgi:hypothetical protein